VAEPTVVLLPLDDALTDRLLAVAVSDATPRDVMPPTDGPPGWTPANRAAFVRFHRERNTGMDGPAATVMHAILLDDAVVGMIRMTRRDDEPDAVETGMWIGRSARGRGLAVAALRALVAAARAAGARAVVADTTPGNAPALAALRRLGAALRPDGDKVYARLDLTGPSSITDGCGRGGAGWVR
jgi:RimJ/RimL family protein N-acetyltransferase